MTVAELRAKRQEAWELLKELATSAADESRSFTAVERRQWDQLNELLDEYDARVKACPYARLMPGEQVHLPGDLKVPPPPPADTVTHTAHTCCCPNCPGGCLEASV